MRRPSPSRIHRGLVGERALVGRAYLADGALRGEYERDIAPRTVAALDSILAAVALPPPSRALDLGAGTGAVGQWLRARWPAAELVAVDRVRGPGIVCADVTRAVRPPGVAGRFDLVVAAHLLNELPLDDDGRARLVAAWCRDLMQPDGTCLLLEPALRPTSRGLLAVRDRLLLAGLFVVAPCLLQSPCPALIDPRDFCHSSTAAIVAGRSRVDYSYLVLRRQGVACTDTTRFRVVSDAMKDKGRLRFFACGPAGRLLITRLDRERSPENQACDELVRGDVLALAGAVAHAAGLRCVRSTSVTRTPR